MKITINNKYYNNNIQINKKKIKNNNLVKK